MAIADAYQEVTRFVQRYLTHACEVLGMRLELIAYDKEAHAVAITLQCAGKSLDVYMQTTGKMTQREVIDWLFTTITHDFGAHWTPRKPNPSEEV